eukprot:gene17184-17377_t
MGTGIAMRGLWMAGASLAVMMGASPALADAAAAPAANNEPSMVQTLVVTAQRREEAIQDVPVAVSAFSADSLKTQQIQGGADLLKAIPNVNSARGNFGGFNFQIRGIGTKTVGTSADGGIGVHENDIPQIANTLGDADFFDDRYDASITLDGGNYNSQRLQGYVNVPFGETFAVRAAVNVLKRDGFATNTLLNTNEDNRDLWQGRLSAQWKPNDRLRVNFMWERYREDDHRDRVGKELCIHDPGPTSVGGVATNTITQNQLSQGCSNGSLYGSNAYGLINTAESLAGQFSNAIGLSTGDLNANGSTSTDWRTWASSLRPTFRNHSDQYQLKAEWDLTDNILVTNNTSYSRATYFTQADYSRATAAANFNAAPTPGSIAALLAAASSPAAGLLGAPITYGAGGATVYDPQVGTAQTLRSYDIGDGVSRQFSEELRAQTSFKGPLNYSGGINFSSYNTRTNYYVISNGLTAPVELIDLVTKLGGGTAPYPLDFTMPPIGTSAGGNYYDNRTDYRLGAYAAFGEVYYKPTDDLKVTLGLRYGVDRKWDIGYPVQLLASSGLPIVTQTVAFKEWTGRLNVEYTPHLSFTDKTLVYATYSRGYKPGGFNPGITPGLPIPVSFNPEFVNAFEVGTKNTLLGGSMILNANAFYYDYQGYQISAIVNRNSVNTNINAKVYGLEVEGLWEPIRHLRLNGSAGYLHTEITSGSTADQLNLTAGDPTLSVVKALGASNCTAKTQDVATVQALVNYTKAGVIPASVLQPISGLFSDPSYYVSCDGIVGLSSAAAAQTASGAKLRGLLTTLGLPQFTGYSVSTTGTLAGVVNTNVNGVNAALKGNELPNSPHFTINLGVQYEMALDGGWTATPHADFYFQDKSYARIFNTAHDEMRSYELVNMALIVEKRDWDLKIQAYVKNVFDKTYIQDQYLTDASSGLYTNIFIGDPRTYGLSVTKKF